MCWSILIQGVSVGHRQDSMDGYPSCPVEKSQTARATPPGDGDILRGIEAIVLSNEQDSIVFHMFATWK